MKKTTLLLCLAAVLFSCSSNNENGETDTMHKKGGFSIALIPISECLPLYYAAERGIDVAQGFPLDIHSYMAQCDASKALADSLDAGFACRESAVAMTSTGKLSKCLTLSGKWTFMASPASRIRKVSDLADRVVAVAPGALTESLAKETAAKAGLGGESVMYPHVVCYNTAASMLIFNQVDATVLPEPYASYAAIGKAATIETFAKDDTGYILLKGSRKSNIPAGTVRKKLQTLYNMAADSLANADKETLEAFLQSVCKIYPEKIDVKRLNLNKAR